MDVLNRCYVGIRLPAELQAALGEAQTHIRRRAGAELVRWTPAAEIILTLVPLGEMSVSSVFRTQQELAPVASRHRHFRICLEGVGGSPTMVQPRFLWTAITEDIAALEALHQDLLGVLKPIVPEMEVRPFQPHVPLGRLKQESEQLRSALGRAIKIAAVGTIGEWEANAFELIRVSGTSAGPTHITVQSYPLAGG